MESAFYGENVELTTYINCIVLKDIIVNDKPKNLIIHHRYHLKILMHLNTCIQKIFFIKSIQMLNQLMI